MSEPNWKPFRVCGPKERPPATRSIASAEGVGDRLRAAAFAELQARHAFEWAAGHYEDAPPSLSKAWRKLALDEQRHLDWLLERMRRLSVPVGGRVVSTRLWHSLTRCGSAKEFARFMAEAEDRGRQAGERFHRQMAEVDPESARIFGKIAEEEVAHIKLAQAYFGSD